MSPIVCARLLRLGGAVPPGVVAGAAALSERHSVVIELVDSEGRVGRGEAAPLADYCSETLTQSERALGGFGFADCETAWCDPLAQLASLPPAAGFAIYSALWELRALSAGLPASRMLALASAPADVAPSREVPCGVLLGKLDGLSLDVIKRLDDVPGKPQIFKVKQRGPLTDPLRRKLAALRAALPATSELRVDLGRSLEPHQVESVLFELQERGVSSVEEPSAAPPAVWQHSPQSLPRILLDESLVDEQPAWLRVAPGYVHGYVLKPTLLGIPRLFQWAKRAGAEGRTVTLTHTFEGPVGLAACAALALGLGVDGAGLFPHAGLAAYPAFQCAALPWGDDPAVAPMIREAGPGFGLSWRSNVAGETLWTR